MEGRYRGPIGTKAKKKRKHYIILWDSDEVTLEPKDIKEENLKRG